MKINSLLILILLFISGNVYANVSLSLTDITFSNTEPVEGEVVRIFARVYNYGEEDIIGLVEFEDMGEPQVISIRPNTYDDVFIDWIADDGNHNIHVNVITSDQTDTVIKKGFFVDKDSDDDGIGDLKDNDNDNDGVPDDEEAEMGTSTVLPDTDGDGVLDSLDAFPLDENEFSDNDLDGIGDNQDLDDDNDGLTDGEEIVFYDTNPLSSDTDKDFILDKVEIEQGTDPNNSDTDGDGVIDSEDQFPLDPDKAYASVWDTVKEYVGKIKLPSIKVMGLVFLALFILLMILIKKR